MQESERLNILLIHTDQQRYDSLGCVGDPSGATPNIDALAAAGTLFTRHISAHPVCSPSRATLLTGLYPPGHGLWQNGVPLPRREFYHGSLDGWMGWAPDVEMVCAEPPTLADVCAGSGMKTAMIGKLHLTPSMAPADAPYADSYVALSNGSRSDWHGPYYGFQHVDFVKGHSQAPIDFAHYGEWLQREHPDVFKNLHNAERVYPFPDRKSIYALDMPPELHHSAWIGDRVCDYLRARSDDGEPFFLFAGFPDPHHAFTPCAETLRAFENAPVREPFDPHGDAIRGAPLGVMPGVHHLGDDADDVVPVVRRYTAAMIKQIDDAVGRIVTELKSSGLWESTIVVFTSDHGDFLGDHGLLLKRVVASDALLHVPFILRAPGADLPSRVDRVMSNADVMPTLLALAGIDAPQYLQGCDVRMRLSDVVHHALVYCSTADPQWNHYAVYDDRYRLAWYPGRNYVELFDHAEDPGECRNVAAENPEIADELRQVIMKSIAEHYNPTLGREGCW
jgi:arylsulfatase A-like enzyme